MLSKLWTKLKPLSNYIITKRYFAAKVLKFYDRHTSGHLNTKLFPIATYGGTNIVTLIYSSSHASIESCEYIKEIFNQINAPIIFEETKLALNEYDDCNKIDENEINTMDKLILSFQRNRNALLLDYRPLNSYVQHERIRLSGTLRLFVAIMKFFPFPGFDTKAIDYDITLIGGNILSDHSELEYEPINGIVETLRICTAKTITKLIQYTYDYAVQHKHTHITFVHKHDQFELSDGLFLKIADELHKQYPTINIEYMLVNDLVLHIIQNPRRFDIICCSERYTNALASIICGVCGGVDLFSSNSLGDHHSLFQPLETRLSLPLRKESDEMSPYSVTSSCVQLLLHMGYCQLASALWESLITTMIIDKTKTNHYCGHSTSADVYCQILSHIKEML